MSSYATDGDTPDEDQESHGSNDINGDDHNVDINTNDDITGGEVVDDDLLNTKPVKYPATPST